MANIAAFHLVRLPVTHRLITLARLPVDRRTLGATGGLVLGRELGTARGSSMGVAVDLSRWALLTVWEDDAALDAWEETSTLLARWRQDAVEQWSVRLVCLTAHGRWGGIEPFPGLAGAAQDDGGGPVAVLTHAKVKLSRLTRFHRSMSGVDEALATADGRLASVGLAEWLVGGQGTFSLWQSTDAMTAFAYGHSRHREVMQRTRAEHWFGEELFARFRPYRSAGTWAGADPLTAITVSAASPVSR